VRVSAGEMSVFLLRAKGGPGANPPECTGSARVFPDVPASAQTCKFIEEVNREGINNGGPESSATCAWGSFCPTDSVTRARMAPLLVRTFNLSYPNYLGYTMHYHPDHLGTIRLITTNSASKRAFHAYYPFGEELSSAVQDNEPFKFVGQETDFADPSSTADDLDYMHARFYNPLIGRFLSPDPSGTSLSNPGTLTNRYAYTSNNPLNRIDPTGRIDYPPALVNFADGAAAFTGFAAVVAPTNPGVQLMAAFVFPFYGTMKVNQAMTESFHDDLLLEKIVFGLIGGPFGYAAVVGFDAFRHTYGTESWDRIHISTTDADGNPVGQGWYEYRPPMTIDPALDPAKVELFLEGKACIEGICVVPPK
jgi:RHS repeat-associated protein